MGYDIFIFIILVIVLILFIYLLKNCFNKFLKNNINNSLNRVLINSDDDYYDEENIEEENIEEENIEEENNLEIEINEFNFVEYNATQNHECAICLEDIKDNKIIQLECLHKYHSECLNNWIKNRKNNIICPECGI